MKSAKGSFGIPDELQEALHKSKKKNGDGDADQESEKSSQDSKVYDAESIPETPKKDTRPEKGDQKGKTSEKDLAEIADDIRKDLGIELTEDDLFSFYFKGNLTKTGITIIPGKLKATFKTITMEETEKIDTQMGEALDSKILESGFRNLQLKCTLSHGLMQLGKPGKLKDLGQSSDERYEALQQMSSLMVDKLSKKWNSFVWLLDYTVSKEMEVKN